MIVVSSRGIWSHLISHLFHNWRKLQKSAYWFGQFLARQKINIIVLCRFSQSYEHFTLLFVPTKVHLNRNLRPNLSISSVSISHYDAVFWAEINFCSRTNVAISTELSLTSNFWVIIDYSVYVPEIQSEIGQNMLYSSALPDVRRGFKIVHETRDNIDNKIHLGFMLSGSAFIHCPWY